MGAMEMIVHGIIVIVDEVPAVPVVDVAVTIVVNAIRALIPALDIQTAFAGIDPHVGGEVGMVVVDTSVDDAHHHIAVAGADIPGLRRLDIGADDTAALSYVEHAP